MTNNWTDIGNSTLVIAMGANPAENHPACMAHINRARSGPGTYQDRAGNTYTSNKPAAKLVVIDPRKTRTAIQADKYVRIRPGTDIAFINGLINYIIDATNTGTGLNAVANANRKQRWQDYHHANSTATSATTGRAFFDNAGVKFQATWPKYSDARFMVDTVNGKYVTRSTDIAGYRTSDGVSMNFTTGLPEVAASMTDAGTVYSNLKTHVAHYTPAVVADICGCTPTDLTDVADLIIANSRCASVAADGDAFSATVQDPKAAGYRAMTMLYAMGITQHTYGSQNVKSFAVLQTLVGNMGRAGGGINALRGIHNVQGSTDQGLLYGNIPAYSANPGSNAANGGTSETFGQYMDALFGNPLWGAAGDGTARDPYVFANGGLQQKGFYSMTRAFFSDSSYRLQFAAGHEEKLSYVTETSANMNALYGVWPKGNGFNHVKMFRNMVSPSGSDPKITAAVVWGQNPAVTEPNQSKVRAALEELDLLVVVDMFETETAACKRNNRAGTVTYLIPACSHPEEAGSVTNSGRVLQWRYQSVLPRGNSKTDLELVLRFAKALSVAGAFDHVKAVWPTLTKSTGWDTDATAPDWDDAYDVLYANQYGWTPGQAFDSEVVAGKVFKQMAGPQNNGGAVWIYLEGWDTSATTRGGDWPANAVINGVTYPLNGNRAKSRVRADLGQPLASAPAGWTLAAYNAAKDGNQLYKNWGYSWLVNRRVLYGNGDQPWDQADTFVGGELVSRMFTSKETANLKYPATYRAFHRLADKPLNAAGNVPAVHVLPGRFPAHTEPYETPRPDLAVVYGYNSTETAAINAAGYRNLIYSGTDTGTVNDYPLVLTTIRCVEHFQGGPITRNNSYNVEAEPLPWIEINSVDAARLGIANGDRVDVITARSNSTSDQLARTNYTASGSETDKFGTGFIARVGVGLQTNQRVGQGVVAIPWHWGDRGLATGSRANDLCIDAMDANTTIPEYKACLCKIVKL